MTDTLDADRQRAQERVDTFHGRCDDLAASIAATRAQWELDVAGGGDGLEASARVRDLEDRLTDLRAAQAVAAGVLEQATAAVTAREQHRTLVQVRATRDELHRDARARLAGRDALLDKLVAAVHQAGEDAAALVAQCDRDETALAGLDDQLRTLAAQLGEPAGALPPLHAPKLEVVDPRNPGPTYQFRGALDDWRSTLLARARRGAADAAAFLGEQSHRITNGVS